MGRWSGRRTAWAASRGFLHVLVLVLVETLFCARAARLDFAFADRFGRLKRVVGLHAVDVQATVEMVDLMLESLGEQAFGVANALLLAVAIERFDRHLLGAHDLAPEARHGQA